MIDVEVMGESVVGVICDDHGWCDSRTAHDARSRRESIVNATAIDMNRRGVNFQPGQSWSPYGGVRNRTSRADRERQKPLRAKAKKS